MILSDQTLRRMIADNTLGFAPLSPEAIQPASIDCRLGTHFLLAKDGQGTLSLDSQPEYEEVEAESIVIPPHSFLLATTAEYIRLPDNLTAFVEGRSSIGRLGLFIQNAGWVDPGFEGRITLELYNANAHPILLAAGRRICQLVFCQMDMIAAAPYRGKYQGQDKTTGSRIHQDET
jgi:dCTP deaminase